MITVAISGLGSRGKDTYAKCQHIFSDRMKIVAVADPIEEKVREVREEYQVDPALCFPSAEAMLQREKLADVMFICTQDRQHYGHAMKAMEKRNSRAIFARARAGLLTGTVIRFFSVSLSCSSKSRLEASTTRAGMSSR